MRFLLSSGDAELLYRRRKSCCSSANGVIIEAGWAVAESHTGRAGGSFRIEVVGYKFCIGRQQIAVNGTAQQSVHGNQQK